MHVWPMLGKLTVALVVPLLCGAALAPGSRLFDATDFVAQDREAAVLNAEERKVVDRFRNDPRAVFKSVQVTRANSTALTGGVMTLALPDGTNIEFTRVMTPSYFSLPPDGTNYWRGADIRRMAVPDPRAWGDPLIPSIGVYSHPDGSIHGDIRLNGRYIVINSLPGKRHAVVMEHLPHELDPCWCMTGFTAAQIEACKQWRAKRPSAPAAGR